VLKLLRRVSEDSSGSARPGAAPARPVLDNSVDRATGTIRARAEFSNKEGLFTPGMFARVQVPASAPYQALLVPDVAIVSEQARKYVLVVDAADMVVAKYVQIGNVIDGLRVIKAGLNRDDRVVVNGLLRARPGNKVTPVEERLPAQASAPESKGQAAADP